MNRQLHEGMMPSCRRIWQMRGIAYRPPRAFVYIWGVVNAPNYTLFRVEFLSWMEP